MKKKFIKKLISDLPTLIFSRYETGTTSIFFYALLLHVTNKRLDWVCSISCLILPHQPHKLSIKGTVHSS